MGDEQQVPPFGRADRRDQVADPRAGDGRAAPAVAGEIVGDARVQADGAHLGDQPLAHRVAGVAVDRVRPLVAEDALQPRHRAVGVEAGVGFRRGGRGGEDQQRALQRHRGEQGSASASKITRLPHPPPPLSPLAPHAISAKRAAGEWQPRLPAEM